MKPEDDDREPIEVLYDIEATLESLKSENDSLDIEPRISIEDGTFRKDVLEYIANNEPVTLGELKESPVSRGNHSRSLTALHNGLVIDRQEKNGTYEYTINRYGRKELNDGQQTIEESTQEQGDTESKPWHDTEVNRGEYYALKAIEEYENENPRSKDINSKYLEYMGVQPSVNNQTIKVAARLSELYEDDGDGFVNRTPKPHRYWLTDKGKDVLQDDD